jgi:hypothetical protein
MLQVAHLEPARDGEPPGSRVESWTVLGDDGPVEPVERYRTGA